MGTRNSSDSGMMMVSGSEEEKECDVGLGLRMQQPENDDEYSRKKTTPVMMSMAMPHRHLHHHHHHHHPYQQQYMLSPSSSGRGVVAGDCYHGGVGGSIFSGTSNHHLACVDEEAAAAAALLASGSAADSSSSAAASAPVSSSSGRMAASANARAPFTAAQWQEMERQSMILMHMMPTPAPVPPELLLPITKSLPTVLPSQSNRGSDPEPWRCRRTDGKKWRCSRDVAPHQKYCERHSHKNRPRSRKPVELQADYTNAINTSKKSNVTPTNSPSLDSCQNPQFLDQTPNPTSVFPTTVASAYEQPRGLEWFMKGETISNQDDYHHHQWQPMHATFNRIDPFHLKQPHLPLSSYSDYGGTHQLQETRHFIDAWSTPHREDSSNRAASVSTSKKMPISSLSLTMCGIGEEDSENTDMGMRSMGGEREKSGDLRPPHWMMSPGGSWMGSTTPGGPLAEALCLGTANASSARTAGAGEASPEGCIGVTPTSGRSSPSKDEGHELNLIG